MTCATTHDCPLDYTGFAALGGLYGVLGGVVGMSLDSSEEDRSDLAGGASVRLARGASAGT